MNDWERMKEIDIRTVSRQNLEDITTLQVEIPFNDRNMRMKHFVEKVKNPYCFRVGDVIVKSTFLGGASLKERIEELVSEL